MDVEAFCRMRRLSRLLGDLELLCKRRRQLSWLPARSRMEARDLAQLTSAVQNEFRACLLLRSHSNGRLSKRTWRCLDACVRAAERKLLEQEMESLLDPWLLSHKAPFPRLRRLCVWLRQLLHPWRQRDVISYVVEVAPMVDVSVSKVMDALDPEFPRSAAHYSFDISTSEGMSPQHESACSYRPDLPS